jgi:hypothetical protein
MTLSATPPLPRALEYQLTVAAQDKTLGNAALPYYQAQLVMPGKEGQDDSARERIEKWLDLPLADLPLKEVSAELSRYKSSIGLLGLGSRCGSCDWGYYVLAVETLLPRLSDYRELARVLALKARVEIAQGHFDQALATLQIGVALGRHVAEGPFLINSLVGVAIEALMARQLEVWMQSGGPNLYWALAWLPKPLVDMRKGLENETTFMLAGVPGLRDVRKGTMSKEKAGQLLDDLFRQTQMMAGWTGENRPAPGPLGAAIAMKYYGPAKKHLATLGRTKEEIEAMPVAQAVLIYMLDDYEHWRDELFKWNVLPYWQAEPGRTAADQAFQKWMSDEGKGNLLTLLLPSLGAASYQQAVLDRRVAALQTIEAVRLYAAAHDGKCPASLEGLTDAPAPLDPVTGKPFVYQTTGDSFVLDAPAPKGRPVTSGLRYEVTIQRQAAANPKGE